MGLKTLHLTNAYHPTSGGIRTMYRALMDQAEREGREIRLVVPAERDSEERLGRYAVVYEVRAPRAPAFDRRYRMMLPHRFLSPRARLWDIVRRERPDVVEVCDKYSLCFFAGLLRRLRRPSGERPTVVGLSCERLDDNVAAHVSEKGRGAASAFLGRIYVGMFDAHIANSEYTADELRRAMVAPHQRPVHVAAMGVSVPRPLEPGARERLRRACRAWLEVPDSARIVLYAGRLSPEKNVGVLAVVAARLARLPDACLVVAGDGPLRIALERACRLASPGTVRFPGHLEHAALLELLAASDLFVHPNPREPFGIGPLEAMAAGLPIVAPRAGGILSYATDDNAWLTGTTPEDLAAGVQHALACPRETVARALAARAAASRFAWPTMASHMFRLYDAIHEQRVSAISEHSVAVGQSRSLSPFRRRPSVAPD